MVRVSREGTIVFEGAYGPASRAWGVPNSIDTRFDTASITKLFTAVAALQAVEVGALSLDTKAVGYLGLEGTSVHADAELRHLITHTSGIADDADEEAGEDYSEVWRHHISYLVREVEDMLPLFVDRPDNFAPGEGCRYCNVAFDLAGPMIEKATGDSYRHRIQSHVYMGYGLEFTFDLDGSLLYYEKEGINAGTSAVLRHYPSTGTTLTMLSNMESERGPRRLDRPWMPFAVDRRRHAAPGARRPSLPRS